MLGRPDTGPCLMPGVGRYARLTITGGQESTERGLRFTAAAVLVSKARRSGPIGRPANQKSG